MREYRGKCKETGKWIYGWYVKNVFDKDVITYKEKLEEEFNQTGQDIYHMIEREVIPETVGQWIGLLDKNGVKIYEGDIAKDINGITEQIYCFEGLLILNGQILHGKTDGDRVGHYANEIEVVGNVFENRELLEV